MYDFSVDYNAIDKSNILKIYKYLMTKNSIKEWLDLLNEYLLDYYVLGNPYLIALLIPNHVKCIFLNNQQYMTQPTLIN